jgi:hypothetical protein
MKVTSTAVFRVICSRCGRHDSPNTLIGIFGFPPIQDNWIRVLGALAFNFSFVYFPMARALPKGFVLWSIYSRHAFCGFTILFVLLGWFPPNLLIFGALDAICASWTWFGLEKAAL